jgi:hypothetical protein
MDKVDKEGQGRRDRNIPFLTVENWPIWSDLILNKGTEFGDANVEFHNKTVMVYKVPRRTDTVLEETENDNGEITETRRPWVANRDQPGLTSATAALEKKKDDLHKGHCKM